MKACVLVRVAASPEVLFEDRRFSERCWTHSLTQLMKVAGLEGRFLTDAAGDPQLAQSWEDAKDRNEASRYERKTKSDAQRLYKAVADKKQGMMSWISRHW